MKRSEIIKMAQNKMISGAKKHGKWDPKKDTRDLIEENIQENLDSINYHIMEIQKLDEMRKRLKSNIKI